MEPRPGAEDPKRYRVELPVAAEPSGVLCRPAHWNALESQCSALGDCGTLGMPCSETAVDMEAGEVAGDDARDGQPSACDGGLVCADQGDPEKLTCLMPCAADADCGSHGVSSCQGGLCRLARSW